VMWARFARLGAWGLAAAYPKNIAVGENPHREVL